jgi:hypothetical protein
MTEFEAYLTPAQLPEHASALYASTKGPNSYTVTFRSQYWWALFWSYFAVFGTFTTVQSFTAIIRLRDNVPEHFQVIAISALFMLGGAWLLSTSIDLQSITVSSGRAIVAWRLFGWPIRTTSFEVRLVVVKHDIWKRGGASTDRTG